MGRKASVARKTQETDVRLSICLDGTGQGSVATGSGFFDHMLTLFSRHSRIDLEVKASGDTEVDYHHTVEDVGIALGQALKEALGKKEGIERYGAAMLPMDEAIARIALDLSGRPYLVFSASFPAEKVGDFDSSLVEEFFRAIVTNAALTLHIEVPCGRNTHHMAEAIFKGFARSLRDAVRVTGKDIPSTKGVL